MPLYQLSVANVEGTRVVRASTIAGARNHIAKEIITAESLDAEAALKLDPSLKIEDATTEETDPAPKAKAKPAGKKSPPAGDPPKTNPET